MRRLFTQFALWVRLLFLWMARVKIELSWVDSVHEANRQGTVVHVAEVEGFLDYLVLYYWLRRSGLKPPVVSNLQGRVWLRPIIVVLLYIVLWPFVRLFRKRDPVPGFVREVQQGNPSLLFLKRARFVILPGGNRGMPYLKGLVAAQSGQPTPIILQPHVIFWSPAPETHKKGVLGLFLGEPNSPGLRRSLSFLLYPSRATLRSGEGVNLLSLRAENPEMDDETLARKASFLLHRSIDREEKVYRGPMIKTAQQVRDEMLYDHDFMARIEQLGAKQGLDPKLSRRRAAKYVKQIAADFRFSYIEFLSAALSRVFRKIFSSFVVDLEAIDTIKEASKETPCVLIPCHRSYMDFLVISYLAYLHGIVPPHIAAGANLSFFPMGSIFRRCGAFFIRRKIGDDFVYQAVLAQYIRKLLKEGHSMEFFIEGGRSRTGKALAPKFGILGYITEAVLSQAVRDITIVPIALNYERVVEMEGHARELTGKDKNKEDLKSLVSSAQVLDSRFGNLYFTAGRPIRLSEFLQPALAKGAELPEEEKRRLVRKLGYRVLDHINRAYVLNPTALVASVLLSHHRRGIRHSRLLELCGFLVDFASLRQHALAPALQRALKANIVDLLQAREVAAEAGDRRAGDMARGRAIASVLDEAIDLFDSLGYINVERFEDDAIIHVVPSARIYMNYYRNNCIHIFQREAIVTTSLIFRHLEGTLTMSSLASDSSMLSQMLKREFIFRSGDLTRGLQAALRTLDSLGLIRWEGASSAQSSPDAAVSTGDVRIWPGTMDRLVLLRNTIMPVLESYLLCARCLLRAEAGEEWFKRSQFVKDALATGHKEFRDGTITCQEAVASVSLENAIETFLSSNLLQAGTDSNRGKFRFAGPEARSELEQLERRLHRFLAVS